MEALLAWGAVVLIAVGVSAISSTYLTAKEKKISRTVTGVVLDEAENGIVGAAVQLTDLQTGRKSAAYSGEGGQYQFSDLKPSHDYEIQATFKGSSSEVRRVSSVDTRNRIVINLTISPAKQ